MKMNSTKASLMKKMRPLKNQRAKAWRDNIWFFLCRTTTVSLPHYLRRAWRSVGCNATLHHCCFIHLGNKCMMVVWAVPISGWLSDTLLDAPCISQARHIISLVRSRVVTSLFILTFFLRCRCPCISHPILLLFYGASTSPYPHVNTVNTNIYIYIHVILLCCATS